MKDFGTPETWGMTVEEFLEDKNLKASLIDDLVPGPLKDELKKDFNPQQETYEEYLKRKSIPMEDRPFNMAEGGRMEYGKGALVTTVKDLLGKIQPYQGAIKIGESTKKISREPELAFMEKFLDYAKEQFGGNFSEAARSIGQSREKIKGIFDRVRLSETGTRAGSDVGRKARVLEIGEDFIPYSETTTKVNYDKNYLKKLTSDVKPDYYTADQIAKIFKIGVPGGAPKQQKYQIDSLTQLMKNLKVKNKSLDASEGGIKSYDLKDAVKKITDRYYDQKQVFGAGTAQAERTAAEQALDKELYGKVLPKIKSRLRSVSKEEDIYSSYKMEGGQAIPDVGHPISIKETNKFPKLFKDSNVNKINTLTFQDPYINQNILLKEGYESSHNKLFKELNKFVDKELTYNDIKKIKEIKKEMNALHDDAVKKVSNLAKENTYYKGQEKNIPRLDIKVPTVGESFKSKDIYVNMNKVNPASKVGYIDKINPNAKKISDLTKEQRLQYEANIADQYKNSVSNYYKQMKYPKEQIEELSDAIEMGTDAKKAVVPQGFEKGGPAKKGKFGKAASAIAKGAGKSLGVYFSPSYVLGDYAVQAAKGNIDLEDPEKRIILGLEAAFAPELVKGTIYATKGMKDRAKQKLAQRILNLGLPTIKALKYARAISPVGIASLLGEAGYYGYKNVKKESERREALGEEGRLLEDAQQSSEDVYGVGAAKGGLIRIGLKDGPKDPSKRKFMKTAVGIASLLPFGIGKVLQKPAVKEGIMQAAPAAERGWSWVKDNFWDVVATVKNKASGFAKLRDGDVRMYKDMEVVDGPESIRVRYKTDNGNTAETVYIKPSKEVNPETGEIIDIPGDFEEYQDVYRMGKDDYYKDFEEEIIDPIDNVKKIIKGD